jgi:hypothetical protein
MSEEEQQEFPIDLSKYQKIALDPFSTEKLSPEIRSSLLANIDLCRDTIIFFTACGTASGSVISRNPKDVRQKACTKESFFLHAEISEWQKFHTQVARLSSRIIIFLLCSLYHPVNFFLFLKRNPTFS